MNKILLINTFYYLMVFIVLGVPIWYLTTSTYRATLPFESIDKISASLKKIDYQIKLQIVYFSSKDSELLQLEKDLKTELYNGLGKIDGIVFNFDSKIRKASSQEHDLGLKLKSIEGFLPILNLIS